MTEEEDRAAEVNTLWKRRAPFYASVGQAISLWASMEGTLIEIAAKLLNTSAEKTGLVLYSTNFFAWLTIIDELFILEPRFSAHRQTWGEISHKLRGMNDIRVRLAHHTVWDGNSDDDNMSLGPGRHDSRKKWKSSNPLTHREVTAFTNSLFLFDKEIEAFLDTLKEPPSPFSKTLLGLVSDPPAQADAQPLPTPEEP